MRSIARLFVLFAALALHHACPAMPAPDPGFGTGGMVRIGVPSGANDIATASARQQDGKLLVGGYSQGRQSYDFVTRFLQNGSVDPSFGSNGTATLPTVPRQIALQADGSIVVVAIRDGQFVLIRLTPAGVVDTQFGTAGLLVVGATPVWGYVPLDDAIFLAVQPDGKLLVATDATQGSAFALQLRRYLPNGAVDTGFGTNGTRIVGGLPPNFVFRSRDLAHGNTDGGITLAASPGFTGGTYLLLRLTPDGVLDSGYGNNGYVSGYDVGHPADLPVQIMRTPAGLTALVGNATDSSANPSLGQPVLWEVGAQGFPNPGFGIGGRQPFAQSGYEFRLGILADGGLVVGYKAANTANQILSLARFDANGAPHAAFGSGGSATVTAGGYANAHAIGIYADAAANLTIAAWAPTVELCSFICTGYRNADVVLFGVSAAGTARADFGSGGTVIWNSPALSYDQIDAMVVEPSGNLLLAGFSDATGNFDFLVSRLKPDGGLDASYGVNGRLSPNQYAGFAGIARAVRQADDALVVVAGTAIGLAGTVGSVTAFRATAGGTLDAGFKPALSAPTTGNAAIAFGARPDGRLVYATLSYVSGGFAVVMQQKLADGTSDPSFGTAGTLSVPLAAGESSRQADLVVLNDGSVVFVILTTKNLRLFKVDASGVPVASFGSGGQLILPGDLSSAFAIGSALSLLALADGNLLAAVQMYTSDTSRAWLHAARISANGSVIRSVDLLAEDAYYLNWNLAALPDGSAIIARSVRSRNDNSVARVELYRLLSDDSLDPSFGPGGAYVVAGLTSASALALDAGGKLLVAGQDSTSAVVERLVLGPPAASVPVLEYFNVNLGHYFITAGAGEIASIDNGGAGPGWQRTGYGFRAFVIESGIPPGASPVCRFYGTPGSGPNSHFYTVDQVECGAVKRDPGWFYEGLAFYVFAPQGGACAAGLQPVYRAYNNRFAQNDSNHRYATDAALLEPLLAKGWTMEGIVFCAPAN